MAKILLVEDDNNLREIYEARLMAEGYQIVTARDGEEALAIAKKEQPDLVISDVMMPRISGFEMLDILRNTEGLKHVKVIMLTALGQAEDKTRAESLGADRYLVKSQVTLEDIVKSAADLLAPSGEVTAAPSPTPAVPAPAPAAAEPVAPVMPMPPVAAPPVVAAPVMPPPAPAPPAPAPLPVTPPPAVPPVAPVVAAAPAAPAPLAPAAPTPTADQVMATAVNDLVASTAPPVSAPAAPAPAPAPTPLAQPAPAAPPVVAAPVMPPPAPAPPAPAPLPVTPPPAVPPVAPVVAAAPAAPMPAPTVPAPAGDDTTRKKVIEPIPSDGKSSSDDLHALLAKEGITDMDTPEQNSATSAALPGTQPMQHAPGHVISPNATDANGQPVDPNSIAL